MGNSLEGKVALITGAARGQGRAHAVKLAGEGADIIAVDIAGELPNVPYESATPEDLAETVRLVEAQDRRIVAEQGDVRDLARLKEIVAKGASELGRLDIVVANAGICQPKPWDEITEQDFRDTLEINTFGAWNTVMATAPLLVEAGNGGSIIIISSYAGRKMQPFMIHYTTSKHALVGMTRAFAAELGRHKIRVNSIHPGGVATPMGGGNMLAALERAGATYPRLNDMGQAFLDPSWSEAEDIADAVAFLASDAAKGITAEQLSIDQGAQHF